MIVDSTKVGLQTEPMAVVDQVLQIRLALLHIRTPAVQTDNYGPQACHCRILLGCRFDGRCPRGNLQGWLAGHGQVGLLHGLVVAAAEADLLALGEHAFQVGHVNRCDGAALRIALVTGIP